MLQKERSSTHLPIIWQVWETRVQYTWSEEVSSRDGGQVDWVRTWRFNRYHSFYISGERIWEYITFFLSLSDLTNIHPVITESFQNPGLEALYQDRYWDVPTSGGGFIVNIGTLISDITDGRVLAVRHRVRQIRQERFSIPFFFTPS